MSKTYYKPLVTRIEMRPAEALFSNCKMHNDIVNASCLATNLPGSFGCVRADGTCLNVEGS